MDDAADFDKLPWCHVYAQYAWHGELTIEGTREALVILREAIEAALTSGMDSDSASLFTTDGEGYHAVVRIRNRAYLERQPLPYTAPYAGGVGAKQFEREMVIRHGQSQKDAGETNG